MAKDKSPKKDKKLKKAPPKKTVAEDLEKTVLDVDIRKLAEEEDLEETVMVELPPEEEFAEDDFFTDEDTADHEIPGLEPPEAPVETKEEKEAEIPAVTPEAEPVEESEKVSASEIVAKPAAPAEVPITKPQGTERAAFSWVYTLGSLLLFLILGLGLLEALRSGGGLRLPAIVAMGFATLILVGTVLKRWETRKGFVWIALAWFAYISYAGFYYLTSQTPYFLNFNFSALMGWALLFVATLILGILLAAKGVKFWVKIPASLGWIILAIAVLLSAMAGRSLEAGVWGPGLFASLPISLRPGVLALSVAFPLLALSIFLSAFSWRRQGQSFLKGPGLPLLLIAILGTLLGARLLDRQGVAVPLLDRVVATPFFGSTQLDPEQSSIRLILAQQKPSLARAGFSHLLVAASRASPKGSKQVSALMVRNLEGQAFVQAKLGKVLRLVRGGQVLRGVKVQLQSNRLGQSRKILLWLPSAATWEQSMQQAVVSGAFQLMERLASMDRLYLMSGSAWYPLSSHRPKTVQSRFNTLFQGKEKGKSPNFSQVIKKLSTQDGLKQILYMIPPEQSLSVEEQKNWQAQAKKQKIDLSFIQLGKNRNGYTAMVPSELGFELLSAAATVLGDYTLEFPKLPPLPQILIDRTPQGAPDLREGQLRFKIQGTSPQEIAALQLKVDNNPPMDLDTGRLSHQVDLKRLKLPQGKHQFTIQLTTQSGDEVQESFETDYRTQRALQFIKPLENDSIAGSFNVLLAPGERPDLASMSVELFVDGVPAGTVTTAPYLISLDAKDLAPGEHQLQAVQTFSDNTTQTVAIKVQANPSVSMVKIVRPSKGEFLSNLAEIEVQIGGGVFEEIQKVDYYVDGQWIGESTQGRFLWDNHRFPAGRYFIQARAHLSSSAMTTDAVPVQLAQGQVVVQADPAQSPTGKLFPENVSVLIDLSQSMNEAFGKAIKLDLAKAAVFQLKEALPENVQLTTRVFGGGHAFSEQSCRNSRRFKPEQLSAITAEGSAPLAYALAQMGKDIKKQKGSRVGLLITDSWDGCGKDPIAVAQNFVKNQSKFPFYVIYFEGMPPTQVSLLKSLAEVTGGRAYLIKHPEDFVEAIRDAVQVNFTLYDFKNTAVVQQPLNNQPFYLRTGDYRLEVDTVPPLQQEPFHLSAGAPKIFTVLQKGEKYQFQEE